MNNKQVFMAPVIRGLVPPLLLFLFLLSTGRVALCDKNDSSVKPEKLQSVWVVKQQNEFIGKTTLYIAQDAVKFVAQEGQLEVVGREPNWNAVVFRPQEKIGCRQPFREIREHGLNILRGVTFTSAKRAKFFDARLRLDCYEITGPIRGRFYDGNDPAMFQSTRKVFARQVRYECSRAIVLPEHVNQFLTAIYRQGDIPGIPLEKDIHLSDGSVTKEFWTEGVFQKQLPSSFFDYPKSFKPVALNSPDLLFSGKQQKSASDIFKSVIDDIGAEDNEPSGSKRSPIKPK